MPTQDDLSFKRIINTPSRRFGNVSMARLQEQADIENLSLYDTLHKNVKANAFDKPSIIRFIRLIDELTEKSKYMSVSDLFDLVFKDSGLEDMYRTEADNERLENIAELKQSIKEYEIANAEEDEINLETYLQDIALYTNADYKNDGETVKLMTIHQSKGLEFPVVFVCGLSEGVFPSHRTIRERKKNGEEEERRLMYVAVTRAEQALLLTESEGYNAVTRTEKFPSRFIQEVKDGLLEIEGDLTKEQMIQLFEGTKQLIDDLDNDLTSTNFHVGDRVAHKFFGFGEIVEESSDTSYKVRFAKGDRFVQSNFLKLWDGKKTLGELYPQKSYASERPANRSSYKVVSGYDDTSDPLVKISDIVEHEDYGKGTVREIIYGKDDRPIAIDIDFIKDNNSTIRRVLIKSTKLKFMP